MNELARSSAFWWVLLGVATAVIVGCAVLLMSGYPRASPWFRMFGCACTIVVCAGNIKSIRRRSRR